MIDRILIALLKTLRESHKLIQNLSEIYEAYNTNVINI